MVINTPETSYSTRGMVINTPETSYSTGGMLQITLDTLLHRRDADNHLKH